MAGSHVVRFPAADDVRLEGRLFPSDDGRIGVVLSHMGRPGDHQAAWFTAARALADLGYTALTYNRRGVCPSIGAWAGCSGGEDEFSQHWLDVLGAIDFLHRQGIRQVFVVGASIGAMASFRAVEEPGAGAAGVVWIAGADFGSGYEFLEQDVGRVRIPKLFVSSEDDAFNGAEIARLMFSFATEPKRLEILPGAEHGTDMFEPGAAGGQELIEAMVSFLRTYAR